MVFFCAFLWSRILLKLLLGVFVIILNILVKTRALLSRRFPSGEFFCFFLRFKKDEFQDRVGWNCCRRHVKGKEATSNTKIVASMPAAAATAAGTSTFTATVITANIIDQTFTIFFGRREPPLLVILFINWQKRTVNKLFKDEFQNNYVKNQLFICMFLHAISASVYFHSKRVIY